MKRSLLLLLSLGLLAVPVVSAEPVAAAEGCDPNNVDVNCVFWEALGLLIPEKCVEANNFITCTLITVLDELPDPL